MLPSGKKYATARDETARQHFFSSANNERRQSGEEKTFLRCRRPFFHAISFSSCLPKGSFNQQPFNNNNSGSGNCFWITVIIRLRPKNR